GCALAVLRADCAEDVGGGSTLVAGRAGAGAALRPARGDLVLLADASLVGGPDFYRVAVERLGARDFLQGHGKAFLKSSIAPCACAWGAGRAESVGEPQARGSGLSVCLAIVMRNSSKIHCARSISRQRTTRWTAGIGPLSIMPAMARR